MSVRARVLELAILGELTTPANGYELRKRLSSSIGPFQALSFGSLYPALKRLTASGLICVLENSQSAPRKQITYRITTAGCKHLDQELSQTEVSDEVFPVALALLSNATPAVRLRILHERRQAVLARREASGLRILQGIHANAYVQAHTELELAQAEKEITWLDSLIAREQSETSHPIPSDDLGGAAKLDRKKS